MTMNLAQTAPQPPFLVPMDAFKTQMDRVMGVPGRNPTGWQICAAVFDGLKRPDGPKGIADWAIADWNHQEGEVSVFIGPQAGQIYEVYLTFTMGHSHNNDRLMGFLGAALDVDPAHLKALAAAFDFPQNPPVIMSPDSAVIYLWMPSRGQYISTEAGDTLDMAALRQGAFWENATVVSWT